jgi:hypothetical protein
MSSSVASTHLSLSRTLRGYSEDKELGQRLEMPFADEARDRGRCAYTAKEATFAFRQTTTSCIHDEYAILLLCIPSPTRIRAPSH